MTDQILQKLFTQATAKVDKELKMEREDRIKKYMEIAIKTLLKTDIITDSEAKAAAAKYKLDSNVINRKTRASHKLPVSTDSVGCGSMGSSSSSGNRC